MPRNMIALVDPNASWLLSWLHGHLGRTLFFEVLARSRPASTTEQHSSQPKNNFIR